MYHYPAAKHTDRVFVSGVHESVGPESIDGRLYERQDMGVHG